MKKLIIPVVALLLSLGAGFAHATNVQGHVYCDGNGLPLSGVTIQVTSTDGYGFTGTATSDESGYYIIWLPGRVGCYQVTAVVGAGEAIVSPSSGTFDFCITETVHVAYQDWLISSPTCGTQGCWLTGGGAKFSAITDSYLGQSGRLKSRKLYNWGGNVYPGCSPTSGDGGQWNTIDDAKKLHFLGTEIQVVRCGNVEGIPPGSTSPVTPYNFIEFKGTGRVMGVQGNKADYPLVYFFARAEDRNEPGSTGQRDGAGKDRFFLNVYTDPLDAAGTSLILIDIDADPATVDPLIITDGNLQIHISSCTTPAFAQTPPTSPTELQGGVAATDEPAGAVEFAAPTPNPTSNYAVLRFALPTQASVSLAMYDVTGRLVRQLVAGVSNAGQQSVTWNLLDRDGRRVPNGVFFARLAVNNRIFTQPLCVTR